jgi:hypothetical protein
MSPLPEGRWKEKAGRKSNQVRIAFESVKGAASAAPF